MLDETVVALLQNLEERDGQILMLTLQGSTTEEIAQEINCSERTVRRILGRIHRDLEKLREE